MSGCCLKHFSRCLILFFPDATGHEFFLTATAFVEHLLGAVIPGCRKWMRYRFEAGP